MAVVTLTWHSDIHNVDLVTITVREMSPVSGRFGEIWWEVAIRHRVSTSAWMVAAQSWLEAVNTATGLALRNADPELASVLVLLVPDWK